MLKSTILYFILLITTGICAQKNFNIITDQENDQTIFQVLNIKTISLDTASNELAIYKVVNSNRSPFMVAGNYFFKNNTLSFKPINILSSSCDFHIVLKDSFKLYNPPVKKYETSVAVNKFYPIGNRISENTLTFYIEFNQRMKPDPKAYDKVNILTQDGDTIFLPWRQKSYWINNNKTLVLMVHPGRIKKGIHSTNNLEKIFEVNKKININLDDSFEALNGDSLNESFSIGFNIIEKDTITPKLLTQNIEAPKLYTVDPINIVFSEEMDFGLVYKWFKVFNNDRQVSGEISTDNGIEWSFIPHERWAKVEYTVRVASKIGDSCHNQLSRTFETKLKGEINNSSNIDISFIPFN